MCSFVLAVAHHAPGVVTEPHHPDRVSEIRAEPTDAPGLAQDHLVPISRTDR
jgi:hypothetical protein